MSATPSHRLIPAHTKLGDEEKQQLLQEKKITAYQLPKILRTDPALHGIQVKEGDIIKIDRASPTVGTATYYRVVING